MRSKPLWPDDTTYFLTGSTFLHYPYFREYEQKQILLNQIKKIEEKLGIDVSAYSIAINHYHIKFFLQSGSLLSKIKQMLHGGTSFAYKKKWEMRYKEMWQSSKIFQVTSEEMDWKVTGYVIGNLLKHREVSTFDELRDNPFSSYYLTAEKYGEEYARDLVYSVIDTSEDEDGMVDTGELGEKILPHFSAGKGPLGPPYGLKPR